MPQKLGTDAKISEVLEGQGQKVDPSEVAYNKGGGIPSLECAACQFFVADHCNLLKQAVAPGDFCDGFAASLSTARKTSREVQSEAVVRTVVKRGGPGSGHHGHKGRRGEIGGSEPGTGGLGGRVSSNVETKVQAEFHKYAKHHSGAAQMLEAWDRAKGNKDLIAGINENFTQPLAGKLIKIIEPGDEGDRGYDRDEQAYAERSSVQIPLYITRVSTDPQTGVKRWYATASGLEKDLYQERMSIPLYKDFIKRIETRDPAPEPFSSKAWNGGLPYLGVAHYLDLDGEGIVGTCEQLFIDGETLKMRGTFGHKDAKPELVQASYDAIKRDIKENIPQDQRVRVSIAFIDWSHDHEGNGIYTRKSLTERCPLCEKGVGDKVYLAGQLVHLALTRRPAYTDTYIGLEERSMTGKSKMYDDAVSIVGEELADDLEEKSSVVMRTADGEVAPGAVVIRQEEDEEDEEEVVDKEGKDEEVPDEDDEEQKKRKKKKGNLSEAQPEEEGPPEGAAYQSLLGGAQTLDEADAFLTKSGNDLIDSWGVLATVLGNISPDHSAAFRDVVRDFQQTLDVQTVQTLMEVRNSLSGGVSVGDELIVKTTINEPEEATEIEPTESHVLDESFMALRSAFDDARETPGDRNTRLAMIQPAVEELANIIQASIESKADASDAGGLSLQGIREVIEGAIDSKIAPLSAQVAALQARNMAPAERDPAQGPERRAIRPGSHSFSEPSAAPSSLKATIRSSVGLSE